MKSLFVREELKQLKTQIQQLKEKIKQINTLQKSLETNKTIISEQNKLQAVAETTTELEENKAITENKLDKKEQLKAQILQTIRTENLTGGEVKQKIVDQANLCSKASFYRYIQELKKEGKIESIHINNQEILYSKS